MEQSLEKYSKMPASKAVIQNAMPAVAAMLMVLIYNLVDTFLLGRQVMLIRWPQYHWQLQYFWYSCLLELFLELAVPQ